MTSENDALDAILDEALEESVKREEAKTKGGPDVAQIPFVNVSKKSLKMQADMMRQAFYDNIRQFDSVEGDNIVSGWTVCVKKVHSLLDRCRKLIDKNKFEDALKLRAEALQLHVAMCMSIQKTENENVQSTAKNLYKLEFSSAVPSEDVLQHIKDAFKDDRVFQPFARNGFWSCLLLTIACNLDAFRQPSEETGFEDFCITETKDDLFEYYAQNAYAYSGLLLVHPYDVDDAVRFISVSKCRTVVIVSSDEPPFNKMHTAADHKYKMVDGLTLNNWDGELIQVSIYKIKT